MSPLSLLGLFLCASFPIHNPDFFWHLALGRKTWEEKAPVRVEPLALVEREFPAQEGNPLPWTGFEWLSELLFYFLWQGFGYGGLVFFKAGMACLAGAAADFYLRRAHCPGIWRGLALLIFAWLTQKRWMVEPEIFSLVFLIALFTRLNKGTLSLSWKNVCAAAAFFSLWANLHGGFVYGLVLCFVYLSQAQEALVKKLWFGVACLTGTLLNPYAWEVYTVPIYLLLQLARLRQENIEWMPPILLQGLDFKFFYVLPLAGLLALWARHKRGAPLHLPDFLVLLLFGLWGTISYRNIAVSSMLIVPLTLKLAYENFFTERLAWMTRRMSLAVLSLLIFGWTAIIREAYALNPAQGHVVWSRYPKVLTETLLNQKLSGGIYLPFPWGGYLSWVLYPERRVYAYGRLDIFHERLLKAQAARKNPLAWQNFLNQWGIDIVLERQPGNLLPGKIYDVRAKRNFFVPRSPFSAYFPRKTWALIFWNDQGVLFVRRTSVTRKEYALLDPHEIEYLRFLKSRGQLNLKLLEAEWNRHKLEAGPSGYDAIFQDLIHPQERAQ